MKLISFLHHGNPTYGIISGQGDDMRVLDLKPLLGNQAPDLRSLISRPLAEVFLANRLQASLNFSLAQMIRQTVDTPIFLQAQPRPGKTLLEPGNKYPIFRKMLLRQDTTALSALFEAAAQRLPELYLPQPAQTIEDGLFTAAPYCQGSARLTVDLTKPVLHPANDYMHANESYGALVLQQLGEQLRQL